MQNGLIFTPQFAHYESNFGKTTSRVSEMDDTDRKLISALRHDARASLSDLAIDLGVSRTTVRGRIERLKQRGDILGFTVV